MSALEPIRPAGALTPRQNGQAGRAFRRAQLTVFNHGLEADVLAEFDAQDAQAIADACTASLDNELDLLEWGLHRAGNSSAAAELVARKVDQLAALNDRRISRRFGR
jgi:hypothetical protein